MGVQPIFNYGNISEWMGRNGVDVSDYESYTGNEKQARLESPADFNAGVTALAFALTAMVDKGQDPLTERSLLFDLMTTARQRTACPGVLRVSTEYPHSVHTVPKDTHRFDHRPS